jgi:hypothetical protein
VTVNNPMPPPSQSLTDIKKGTMSEPWYRYFNAERLGNDEESSSAWLNVKDFGAAGDGSSNDTDAVAAAIAAVANGGTVYFPTGTYMIDPDSLVIGDGTNSADSTVQGVSLRGDASAFYNSGGSVLKARSAGTSMLGVAGPIEGISIENLTFDCEGVVSNGWTIYSVKNSTFRNFIIRDFTGYGIFASCRTSGATNFASHNIFERFIIYTIGLADFGAGVILNGDWADQADWHHCVFMMGTVQVNKGVAGATRGFDLRFCDSISFVEVDVFVSGAGAAGCKGVYFIGDSNADYPHSCGFYGCSLNNIDTSGTIGYNYFDTWGTYDGETTPNKAFIKGRTDRGLFFGDHSFSGFICTPAIGTLTIATGAVTAAGGYYAIDTEAAAATDDLDTINGGVDGAHLFVRAANSARDVVLKDGTGNIRGPGDITLTHVQDMVHLMYDSGLASWLVVSFSDNAA